MEGLALFATPLFRYDVVDPALLAAIVAAVDGLFAQGPGLKVSNHGGAWHSAPDLARRSEAPWRQAAEVALARVRETFDTVADSQGIDLSGRRFEAGLQLWCTRTVAGGYATVHEHHGAGWSFVLYADAGDDPSETGGAIAFLDPRRVPALQAGVPLFPSTFTVRPTTGMLLVFPGWLQHFVHPYHGARARVALSGNVTFQPS